MADKEHVEQLEKDKVELQNKLDHSQRETNRLEEQWKAKVERDTEQQKELEEAKKETRQLQTELEEAKEELKEEQRKAEEAKDQLQNKHKQHLITAVNDLKEEQQATLTELKEEHKKKLEEQEKEHLAKLQEQKQKFENEKKDNEEKLRKEVTKKVTDELESSKIKKMARSLFEAESKLEKAETRIEDLKTENNGLSKTIREKEKEHQNEMAKLRKESRTDSQKQIDEMRERDRQLKAKEEELAVMKRRYNEVQADKEKLENELQLHKKAVSIKVPPLPPQDSTVTQDDESPTHTKSSYNELLLKNSELGYLAQKLQKDLDALTKAKAEMETELEQMTIEIEPLRERHKDDMTKMRNLNFEIDSKQKLLEKSKKEKIELNSQIDELKKKLATDQDRIKNKELKIAELQRSKLEKEKQLTALRTELHEIKEEARKKGKETQKQVPLIRPRDAASPRPPPTPPTRSAAPIDTTLAAKRVVEYKKARELESKVEELTNQLEEMRIEKNKMQLKCQELEKNVKRKENQIQKVSKENTELREENQLLEESRDRNKKELMNEWTTSHKELELAHAQINKLQLQKSDLLVQLERATPSPDLTMSPRTSSPHRRSPSPHRRSPSPIMRIPSPTIISSPSHLPVPITHGPHQSRVIVQQPITEEDFGSQWSLASNESILKEQLEQMEYDKDEVSIEYEELKISHGKLKGLYRALRERYNSLLTRTKNMHSKAQQREKERLQLEKELSLLQAKTQNEYDVERETNLRERLKKSLQRINELEAVLEEQFDKNNNEGELEEEKERNRELNESIEQLTLELYNKKSELEEKELSLTEQEEHVKELESQLAETVGQLEGEIAISTSIKQSMQNRTEGHLVTASPFKAPGSLSFKAKDCLQSVNDTVQQIKRVTSKELSVHTASTCENLVEQVERKLNEATQLIEGGHVALKREREEEEEGFDDTDSVAPSTSGQGNSKKFQGWMEKFQTDKNALNSKIAYLEERLSEGSHKVLQLQSLVSELEGRLNREQSLHVSLLAERDEHITSLSDQIQDTQRVGQKVLEALDETNEAEAEGVDSGEANKLDRAVQELLATVYPRGSTPYSNEHSSLSPHMMSSIGPSMMNHQSTDISLSLSSSNPSPIKTSSHNSSYPTLVPPTEPLTGRRVARAGKVVPKSSKSHLFVALFDYNPKSYCSTGHPERELTLKTGDIISVYGDMDSSGYYNAEYKGQCGLVPAAFIQRMDISDAGSQKRLLNQNLTGSQTNDVIEVPAKLAPPTMFRADRQSDGESLLLSWTPPSLEGPGDLVATGYTLYCDESKIIDINSSSIRQALLKGIDMNSSHILGICSVSKMDPTTVPFSSAMCYYKYGGVPKPYRAVRDYDPEIDSTSLSHPLHLSHESGGIEELEFDEGDTLIIHGKMHEDSLYYGELNGRFGLVPSNYFQEVAESEATPTHNEREENEPVTEIADT